MPLLAGALGPCPTGGPGSLVVGVVLGCIVALDASKSNGRWRITGAALDDQYRIDTVVRVAIRRLVVESISKVLIR
jgi:hypothetical protein